MAAMLGLFPYGPRDAHQQGLHLRLRWPPCYDYFRTVPGMPIIRSST
jgi:hypothetical protein